MRRPPLRDAPRSRMEAHVRAHLGALFEHGPTPPPRHHLPTAPRSAKRSSGTRRLRSDVVALLDELTARRARPATPPSGCPRLTLFGAMNSAVESFDLERGNLHLFARPSRGSLVRPARNEAADEPTNPHRPARGRVVRRTARPTKRSWRRERQQLVLRPAGALAPSSATCSAASSWCAIASTAARRRHALPRALDAGGHGSMTTRRRARASSRASVSSTACRTCSSPTTRR